MELLKVTVVLLLFDVVFPWSSYQSIGGTVLPAFPCTLKLVEHLANLSRTRSIGAV